MKRIGYILFRFFLFLISITPFFLLYLLSDFCSIIMQYIMRYRLKTVTVNLRNSFPEKNYAEIKGIIRRYYKHLCDIFIESIKGFSMNTNQLLVRYICLNPDDTYDYYSKGKDIIIAMSHYANWEWGTQVASKYFMHNVITFYKSISNKYFDNYMQKYRMQHDIKLRSINKIRLLHTSKKEKPKAYFLVGDQRPAKVKKAFWLKFLNQDTACVHGIESYAKLNDLPVFYADVQRTRRGYYLVELMEISKNSGNTQHGEITEKYMKKLEEIIEKKPEDWLWSHKRWKFKKPN